MADSTTDRTTVTTGTSTSTKGPTTYGGGFSAGDLAGSLLGILQQQTATIKTANTSRVENAAAAEAASKLGLELQRQAADTAASAAKAKVETDYQNNKLVEGIQREFNLDPRNAQNLISQNLAKKAELQPQLEAARAEFDKAQSVGLLDNPLQFIFNQLKLPQLAAKNNAIAEQIGRLDDESAAAMQQFDTRRRTVMLQTADQIRAELEARARADSLQADAQLQAAEAARRSAIASNRMQDITIANMMGDNQRQTITSIAALRSQEEQRQFQREQRMYMQEQRQLAADQKRQGAEEDARMDARLKLVSDSMGMPEPMTVRRMKMLDPKQREAWTTAALTGKYGDGLYESLSFFSDRNNRQAMIEQGNGQTVDTAEKLKIAGLGYQSQAEQAARTTGKPLKPEEARIKGMDIYVQAMRESAEGTSSSVDLASAKWGREYNAYRAPTLSFTDRVYKDPKLAGLRNNLVAKTTAELAKTGGVTGSYLSPEMEQATLGTIWQMVRNRQIPASRAAAEISSFYQTAAATHMKDSKYALFGLSPQQAYLYSLELGGNRIKTDLFNPADLERVLTRAAVNDREATGETIFGFR